MQVGRTLAGGISECLVYQPRLDEWHAVRQRASERAGGEIARLGKLSGMNVGRAKRELTCNAI